MKVFFEGTPLFYNSKVPQAGIAHYTYNIYQSLVKLDNKNQYEIFGLNFLGRSTDFKKNFPQNTKFNFINYIPNKVWNVANRRLVLPPIEPLLAKKADVFIFTQFRLYQTLFAKKCFTIIHDIAFEHNPSYIEKKNLNYLRRRVPQAIRKSNKIITISEFTKSDIVKKYAADPDKIIVAHCAVDTNIFKKTKLSEELKYKYGLQDGYVLYLGTIEPRKNIIGLVLAYSKLPEELKQKHPLVLAGGGGWNDQEIIQTIAEAKKNNTIIETGYVEQKDIPAIYSGAEAFLYPSHFEGFGMQILEAMACEVPVLTSKNSSLPEVGGDAALYVDDKSVVSIAKGIEKLLTDAKLRQDLVKRGRQQIKRFSWDKSAQKIIDAINE